MNKLAALAVVAALAVPASAFAGHVDVGIGLNLGGPVYAEPAPEYYSPPPVVYAAPPPVEYVPPPVVYSPYYYYRPYRRHCWWEDGYRVCR